MTQLDLFGVVLAEERQRHRDLLARHRDALICLRDAVSEALEIVVALRYDKPTDTRSPRASGGWAFCVCRAGLRFELATEWWLAARERGETWGWDRRPAHLVSWDELAALIGQDPRRAEIAAWARSLPDPNWRLLQRPYELRSNPGCWHPSYIEGDHRHGQWPARRHAWQLVLDLLSDRIGMLRAASADC